MGDIRSEYRFIAPQIAAEGYRVVSMDVRAHGETTIKWSDYSVAAIGSDMIALIRNLAAGPAIIIGTSMAAGAAVWAAVEAPDSVTALILLGPSVHGETSWTNKLLYTALFARPWGPGLWLRYFQTLYPTRKPADFAQYCAALRANLEEPGRMEGLVRMLPASKAASEERLSRVDVPVLVIMGTKDPDFKDPESDASWVANSMRGTYKMVEEAGHYPHAEMPDITGPWIISFLNQVIETKERILVS
jgi:pimeloyl-ACP methyl ester carboxylesterase